MYLVVVLNKMYFRLVIIIIMIVLQEMCSTTGASEIDLRDGCAYTLQSGWNKLYLTVEDEAPPSSGSSNFNLAQVITTEFSNKTNQIWELTLVNPDESIFWLYPKGFLMNTVSAVYALYPVLSSLKLSHIVDDCYSIKHLDRGLCLASSSTKPLDQGKPIIYKECNNESENQVWIIMEHLSVDGCYNKDDFNTNNSTFIK